jgi:hypothetical protein
VPGGPAGVEQPGELVAAATGVLDRLVAGDELLERQRALGGRPVTGVDHGRQLGRGGPERGQHRGERVVDQQDVAVGVAQRVGDLGRAPADVDRVEHGVGPRHREQVLVVAVGVERQHRDAVTGPHAVRPQRRGQPADPVEDLGEGATAVAEDRRFCVGMLLDGPVQALRQVHEVSTCESSRAWGSPQWRHHNIKSRTCLR